MSRLSAICTLLLALLASAPAFAQFETASVVGAVRDASGASVPDATVTLTSSTTTGVASDQLTTGQGAYEFATVKAGTYLVTAEKTGFAIALVDNVQVQVGARLRVDLQMAVGQVTEKVEVTAAARRSSRPTRASAVRSSPATQIARAAAQRPRILRAGAADDRRPPVGAQPRTAARRAKARSTSTACAAPSTTS